MGVTGGLGCTPGELTTRWWVELDGAPVRSSVRSMGENASTFSIAGFSMVWLSGITAAAVRAGNHSVVVRAGCAGTPDVVNGSSLFAGSVTVPDAGFGTRAAAAFAVAAGPDSGPAAADCLIQRLADGSERTICR